MAILSALFSLVARKLGDLLQAIFGWSITALFGKLPSKLQIALSVALILSIAWPIFVAGSFAPAIAAFVVAFVPVKALAGSLAARIVWIVLAVVTPAIVGAITHAVTPKERLRGSLARTVLHGYPLTLGYFLSFLITAITVPVVKILTLAKGWDDTHVYVQPKPGAYGRVLRALGEAYARAGLPAERRKVPRAMALSTTVLKLLARGALSPMIPEDPVMLVAPRVQAFLYPSDLLLRGDAHVVAHVRAMMTRTRLDQDAYLVAEPAAQEIQDELGRLWATVERHDGVAPVGITAHQRVAEVQRKLDTATIDFDEWVLLDRILRSVARAMGAEAEVRKAEDQLAAEEESMQPEKPHVPARPTLDARDVPTADTAALVKEALAETRELVRIEVDLARAEVKDEVVAAKTAAIGFGVAAASSLVFLTLLAVALVLLIGPSPLSALIVAGGVLVISALAAVLGWTRLPKKPLDRTRRRLESDVQQLKEHVA